MLCFSAEVIKESLIVQSSNVRLNRAPDEELNHPFDFDFSSTVRTPPVS